MDCLAPKGWDVNTSGDGFRSTVPAEQHDRYELDNATCRAQLEFGTFATPAMGAGWYDQVVASADCLRGLGYPISEAPSRETYVEQLVEWQLPDWDPYAEVFTAAGGPSGVRDAQSACPAPTSW